MTARGQMTNLLRGNEDPRSWILCVKGGAFGEPNLPLLSWAFVGEEDGDKKGGANREEGTPRPRTHRLEPTNGGGKCNRARMLWLDTGDRQHACLLVWPIHIFAWIRIGNGADHQRTGE